MPPSVIIDTNVLLIANGSHTEVSDECRKACIARLLDRQRAGTVTIDDNYHIIKEYLHKNQPNQPKGVGNVFLKWLLQNQHNQSRVKQVRVTELEKDIFTEFPDKELEAQFDAPDRKFVAVANASTEKPSIWQAADCKWINWWETLEKSGISIDFLCPDDACGFYEKKFPGVKPRLPKAK